MNFVIRTVLIVTLTSLIAGGLVAQETTATVETQQTETQQTTTATGTAAETDTAEATATAEPPAPTRAATRENFLLLLNRHPSSVSRILSLDPTLVSNEPFLARYPDLADFIAKHPEIRRNPHYYAPWDSPVRPRAPFEEAVETMSIVAVFALIAFALGWLVRTIIEQKRWNQLSRRQSEVHNKILDRFGSTSEVLEYIKTPAGTKFLESAPIPLHAEKATHNAPLTRVMWSVQVGVILAVAALGLLLVSFRFETETAQGLFAMGAIAFSIGAGFIASAVVSIVMSKRLGVWKDQADAATPDDSGLVR